MTQEQKAKAYDEAMERAKAAINEGDDYQCMNMIESIFPEFKKNKDERIRKELIEQLAYIAPDSTEIDGYGSILSAYYKRIEKYRVYIERQGKQEQPEVDLERAKDMFIKALERAAEQTKKGYELTDCDKHSWWEDFKAYSGIKPANTDQINFIEIKHLSLTEEEYKKMMKLLNHEE